ncbi:cyclase family protein [Phycicoccus avicenniae]|uniref:cyclase family protein n=1 Tax=Phycicoccus avicenniae TaxID=2828860 RepID=UPI003D26549D
MTDASRAELIGRMDARAMFDLSVEHFVGMPTWTAAGDPSFQMYATHTPGGSPVDNLSGAGQNVHAKYSYFGDSISMYTHSGTHMDLLNHLGFYGLFWNGWTPAKNLGSRCWTVGGPEHYPPVVARAVLLDIAAVHAVQCLPDGYAITPADLVAAQRHHGAQLRRGDIALIRTGRMSRWPDASGYMENSPGIGLAAARYLAEEVGVMCVGADTIGVEVIPHEEPDTFLPVHCYFYATAGVQIIENVWLEEVAAAGQRTFAFLAFPLKIRGSSAGLIRPVACPLP